MKIRDFLDGNTWVLGVESFASVIFIKRMPKKSERKWDWTRGLTGAATFKTRELAQQCLDTDKELQALIHRTVPSTEIARVRPLNAKMIVGL